MRRAIPVIISTAGGLALLANFHTKPPGASVATAPASSTTITTEPQQTSGSPSAPTTTVAAGAKRTIDGPAVSTPYGDVQVRVTLDGTKIVDVQGIQLPFDRSRSQRLSQSAAPILHNEVLKAQSAQIDLVSGASYTSDAYSRSLQGALDHAGG
ncbi:MAG TPA: FMN-binding protein [Acidimicrobiales bacterium]|jgi:uncharacterized protein with FMN-binding domain